MTAAELEQLGTRYQRALARAEALREQRDKLVVRALAEGWTHAQIADAASMTRGRVGQIAMTLKVRRSGTSTPGPGSTFVTADMRGRPTAP